MNLINFLLILILPGTNRCYCQFLEPILRRIVYIIIKSIDVLNLWYAQYFMFILNFLLITWVRYYKEMLKAAVNFMVQQVGNLEIFIEFEEKTEIYCHTWPILYNAFLLWFCTYFKYTICISKYKYHKTHFRTRYIVIFNS